MKKVLFVSIAVTSGFVGSLLALFFVLSTGGVLAVAPAQNGAPALVSYQGFVSDSNNQPITGTVTLRFGIYAAATGGSPLWQETQNGVTVGNGFFSVLLGSSTPLTAAVFDDTTRYLQVSVDAGTGFTDLPRQRLSAVPYALQAEEARNAATAPWSGLTGVPAGFADGIDNTGGGYENVIVVAKSGGDYTSVAAALNSISNPSATNRYLVWVAPGEYTETSLLRVQGYVHLQGAGPNATQITANRGSVTQGPDATVIQLDDNGHVSDLHVVNTGTTGVSYAILSAGSSRDTLIDNVVAEASGIGGSGHYGLWTSDADLLIRNSTFHAEGVSSGGVNAAVGFTQGSQPLLTHSILRGEGGAGFGFGIQNSGSFPDVRYSDIYGVANGILTAGGSGLVEVHGSRVEGVGGNPYAEAGTGTTIQIGASMLLGSTDGLGTVICAQVWNGAYAAFDSTCP